MALACELPVVSYIIPILMLCLGVASDQRSKRGIRIHSAANS